MTTHTPPIKNSEKETSRLETFSDGVFAIAITLLILELIQFLYSQSNDGLLKLLVSHWQSYIAFAIGFFTLLVCWINHHLIFNYINRTDSNLMWVNGFVLLVVTFTPFPTAVLAQYISKEPNLALGIFGVNYFLMALAAYNITAYTYNKFLITEEGRKIYYRFKLLYRWTAVYTFINMFLCFFSVIVPIILNCVMFAAMAFPKETSMFLFRKKFDKSKK
jgi:uncharacterized membrane protein